MGGGGLLKEVPGRSGVPLTGVRHSREGEEGFGLCAWMARQFAGMNPTGEAPVPLPRFFLKSAYNQDRVCFYGGSFNPWHRGHRACVELCPEENIVVVPDGNPWKRTRKGTQRWDDYLKICDALVDTSCSVYPGFLYADSSPTADWLPRTDFGEKSLLVGADNFLKFDRWKDHALLAKALKRLYVVPRGENQYEDMTEHLAGLNPMLDVIILPRHSWEGLSSSGNTQN